MKFISKELSIKLKEKGFNKPCFGYYENDRIILYRASIHIPFGGNVHDTMYSSNHLCENDIADAPTTYQVLEWLRDEKNVYISILPYLPMSAKNNIMWQWDILLVGKIIECRNTLYVDKNNNYARLLWDEYCANYNDACIAGIEFVIDNLI